MSLTFGFFNSLAHDRVYDATQFSRIFDGIINDGVFMSIGDRFLVTPNTGMTINVGTGRAWFDGTWTENDAPYLLTLDPAEVVLSRIDLIVLETNISVGVRANSLKIIKGTPGSVPVDPTLTRTASVNQYPIAKILVTPGLTTITALNITNMVGLTSMPFVTGILETADITGLFTQWEAEFNAWFEDLQIELSGEVAVNLQAQINDLEEAMGPPLIVGSGTPGEIKLNSTGNDPTLTIGRFHRSTSGGSSNIVFYTAVNNSSYDAQIVVKGSGTTPASGIMNIIANKIYKGSGIESLTGEIGASLIVGNGEDVITTGIKVGSEIPYACILQNWVLTSVDGVSGSISLILERISYSNFPSGAWTQVAVCAMVSNTKAYGNIIAYGQSGKGDILRVRIADNPTNLMKVTLSLKGIKI